jgi:tetratricopeptide (TPR) repeat protein
VVGFGNQWILSCTKDPPKNNQLDFSCLSPYNQKNDKAGTMKKWFICLLLCWCGAIANAQPTLSKEAAARQKFEAADAAYKLQNYAAALKGFQEVYLLVNDPVLLFNIAQCYRQLKLYEEAIKSYQTFIVEAPKHPRLKDAESRVQELRALQQKEATDAEEAAKALPPEIKTVIVTKQTNSPKPFFISAITTGAAGVVSGSIGAGLSFSSKKNIASVASQEELDRLTKRTRLVLPLAITGDVLVGVALLSVTAGVIIKRRAPARPLEASLGATGGSLTLHF